MAPIPGLSLELKPDPQAPNGKQRLLGTIFNRSKIPYAIWHCPYANTRWFAKRVGGGPILAEKDWAKDFPSHIRDSNFPIGLQPGQNAAFAYGPPPWIEALPAGQYEVWVLYREAAELGFLTKHPMLAGKEVKGTKWINPSIQLISNVVLFEAR